ncbi:MAG: ATP-dependent DNA ligase [Planctomycetota bacterium]
MKRFAQLYDELDRTTSTDAKLRALRSYFEEAPLGDAAWGLSFLAGQKIKRLVQSGTLREWARAKADLSPWLFDECYATVGDLAETVTLLTASSQSGGEAEELGLKDWVEGRLLTLRGLAPELQTANLDAWTEGLTQTELFMVIKTLTGGMRIGVSRTLVERAIAAMVGVDQAVIARRLMGEWSPTEAFMHRVFSQDPADAERSQPYPFFLASPILPHESVENEPAYVEGELGDPSRWFAEWKWDGIRGQLIKREGEVFLWSRKDDNLTERFPDLTDPAARLEDGVVLDGEILCWDFDAWLPLDFGTLQTRIGRKALGPKILSDAPAVFLAYDLLERDGDDLREQSYEHRREQLRQVVDALVSKRVFIDESFPVESWRGLEALRQTSRERRVEGVMLKRAGSVYQAGRRRGDWWKWKIEPLTIDAVLTYAQPGHGRRANLMTDYTFGVWDGDEPGQGELVTVTKAYSGLTDAEFAEMDRWIRKNTIERFGPVRRVEPVHVFELAFEGVRASSRHKSGVAFRFPRMKRWRKDKKVEDADTLVLVREMTTV